MEIGGREGEINERKLLGIKKAVPQYFPRFQLSDFENQPVWSGLRPCTPDGLPYLGPCPQIDNATIAAGHAMLGLSLGPVSGSIISRLVTGDPGEQDLRLLAPGRYS